ncbi:MAG TPA: PA14 domain-containing protein, partial [Gemmataceae bacterium]
GDTGGQVPTVATPAAADPNPLTAGPGTNLSVLGADDGGEAALTYTWGVFGSPAGSVNFGANSSNAAKNTVATFSANGTYDLFVAVRDVGGQTVISTVSVTVNSIPTGTGTGLRGVYFDNIDFTGTSVSRTDPTINFNFGAGSPDPAIGADTFSVRWTGFVQPRYTGTYTFSTTTDDGVRLSVNGQLVIDHFVDQSSVTWSGTIALTAGQLYPIQMDYYENGGDAVARLEWQSDIQPREVVPQTQLYTATAAPVAPTGLTTQPVGGSQVVLKWAASAPPNQADDYFVEQSPNGTGGWAPIGTATATGLAVTGLTPGTTYYFRVRAHNGFGTSAYSAVASATTYPTAAHSVDFSGGFTATGLTLNGGATITATRLRLTSGVANQTRSAFATAQQNIAAFSTTFTYTKNGAADGMAFVIQRDPRGAAALGEGGGLLGYGATATPANAVRPSFAVAFNMYNGHPIGTEFLTNGAVDFNYSQSAINVATNNSPITVTITYAAGFLTAKFTQGTVTETKTIAVDLPALLGGTTAFAGFTAATGGQNSTQEIVNWYFDQGAAPAQTANVQKTLTGYGPTSTQPEPMVAHLTWTPAAGAGLYKVERKLTAGGTYAQVGTSPVPTFDDSGLAAGSTYFYRVRANNAVGDGPFSTEIQVTTPGLAASPTAGEVTTVTTSSIAFRWTDNATNEDGFQILRSVDGGAFALLTSLPANSGAAPVTFTDTGLTSGTRYDYRIQSFNLSGSSAFIGVTTATLTTAPTGLTATPGAGSVALTWAAPAGAATYSVYRGTTAGGEGPTPIATGLTTPSYTDTAPVGGVTNYYVVTATDLGGESAWSAEASAALPLGVQAVQVADGGAQRSAVRSVTVTFTGTAVFAGGTGNAAAAFRLTRTGPTGPTGDVTLTPTVTTDAQGRTVVTLKFSGPFTESNTAAGADPSLIDGIYTLTINAANVTGLNGLALDGNADGTAGGNYGLTTHRLFGDVDGDGDVDLLDLNPLVPALFGVVGQPNYNAAFDFDGDGDVDLLDLNQFVQRLFLSGYTP